MFIYLVWLTNSTEPKDAQFNFIDDQPIPRKRTWKQWMFGIISNYFNFRCLSFNKLNWKLNANLCPTGLTKNSLSSFFHKKTTRCSQKLWKNLINGPWIKISLVKVSQEWHFTQTNCHKLNLEPLGSVGVQDHGGLFPTLSSW